MPHDRCLVICAALACGQHVVVVFITHFVTNYKYNLTANIIYHKNCVVFVVFSVAIILYEIRIVALSERVQCLWVCVVLQ